MLQELIHDKINEIFAEYQKANNIISGDIEPLNWARLEIIQNDLAETIEAICAKQPKAPNYDNLTPSWYIYTDCVGEAHSAMFSGEYYGEDYFFTKVSQKICFDDLDDSTVQKIYYKGKEVFYAGWQPGMKYEYTDAQGNTVWVGYFEHWDH